MYINNIVNFQESTTILNACIKKSLDTNWRHHVYVNIHYWNALQIMDKSIAGDQKL